MELSHLAAQLVPVAWTLSPVVDRSLVKKISTVYGPYAVGAASLAVSTLALAAVVLIALVVAAALLTIPAPVY